MKAKKGHLLPMLAFIEGKYVVYLNLNSLNKLVWGYSKLGQYGAMVNICSAGLMMLLEDEVIAPGYNFQKIFFQ